MIPFDHRRDHWRATGNWKSNRRVKLSNVNVNAILEKSKNINLCVKNLSVNFDRQISYLPNASIKKFDPFLLSRCVKLM